MREERFRCGRWRVGGERDFNRSVISVEGIYVDVGVEKGSHGCNHVILRVSVSVGIFIGA